MSNSTEIQNKSFYIKYQHSNPVPIKTNILNPNTFETIFTVSQLIMAAVSEPTRSLLGLPKDFGPLSLHETESGEILESDLNLSQLNTGLTAKTALIIKCLNGNYSINSFKRMNQEIEITTEKVLENLTQLIQDKKTLFSAQDSMETINLHESILKLSIQSLDNIPNFLYCEEIYTAEKEIGIEMPIDRLIKIKQRTIVMIGVSGCGKTRTCYDLCRRCWGLYFDCSVDADFLAMIHKLAVIRPHFKTESKQQEFEENSERLIQCLIATRLLVLKTILKLNPDLQFFEWLCIQRSQRSRELFSSIFTKLSGFHWSISSAIYQRLAKMDFRIIFDESHHMLEMLPKDYRSKRSHQRTITKEGSFAYPISFFSFLSKIVIKNNLKSIWCGTQMLIRKMEYMYSTAGGKPDGSYIFTDFNYLEPSHIFKLLSLWLNVTLSDYVKLFEEISNFLQGRPRLFTSFLHKLIDSSNINYCFRTYVTAMTTNYDSALSKSSFYHFWGQRIDWTIEPVGQTDECAFETRLVSDTLVKLCIASLFGDSSSVAFSPNYDFVSTSLVMVSKQVHDWIVIMAEPLVLCAGLNYFADKHPRELMNYFACKLFCPLCQPNLTAQERGHMMEFAIALRFLQGWWFESKLKQYLPEWVDKLNIQNPQGVIDCRSKESAVNMFIQQLRNADFPWIIFPSDAGPDLRNSIFFCYIKTSSTPNSQSNIYPNVEECKKNISSMDPVKWYKSQTSVQSEVSQNGQKFIHMRFELPYIATSMKEDFINGPKNIDHIICVSLNTKFAQDFFGKVFVESYKKFVAR